MIDDTFEIGVENIKYPGNPNINVGSMASWSLLMIYWDKMNTSDETRAVIYTQLKALMGQPATDKAISRMENRYQEIHNLFRQLTSEE